jgi:hypothetical protein
MSEEVTTTEILSKYTVLSGKQETNGWTKYIRLHADGKDEYAGRLHWDTHDGYSMYWDDDKIPVEAYRPEFEYVLDCITEGDR